MSFWVPPVSAEELPSVKVVAEFLMNSRPPPPPDALPPFITIAAFAVPVPPGPNTAPSPKLTRLPVRVRELPEAAPSAPLKVTSPPLALTVLPAADKAPAPNPKDRRATAARRKSRRTRQRRWQTDAPAQSLV